MTPPPTALDRAISSRRALGFTPGEIARLTGLPLSKVLSQAKANEIRRKDVGGRILFHPADVQRVFGFDDDEEAPTGATESDIRRARRDILRAVNR